MIPPLLHFSACLPDADDGVLSTKWHVDMFSMVIFVRFYHFFRSALVLGCLCSLGISSLLPLMAVVRFPAFACPFCFVIVTPACGLRPCERRTNRYLRNHSLTWGAGARDVANVSRQKLGVWYTIKTTMYLYPGRIIFLYVE